MPDLEAKQSKMRQRTRERVCRCGVRLERHKHLCDACREVRRRECKRDSGRRCYVRSEHAVARCQRSEGDWAMLPRCARLAELDAKLGHSRWAGEVLPDSAFRGKGASSWEGLDAEGCQDAA